MLSSYTEKQNICNLSINVWNCIFQTIRKNWKQAKNVLQMFIFNADELVSMFDLIIEIENIFWSSNYIIGVMINSNGIIYAVALKWFISTVQQANSFVKNTTNDFYICYLIALKEIILEKVTKFGMDKQYAHSTTTHISVKRYHSIQNL